MVRKLSLFVAIVVAMPVLADDAKELKKLSGRWQFTPQEGEEARPFIWEVKGETWTLILSETEKIKGKLRVFSGTTPVCIDLAIDNGPTLEGIYRIDGDKLRIRVGEANVKERPTELPKDDKPMKNFAILVREKP